MINSENQASRKGLEGDRIAVCPRFGCKTLEKIKPLKLGLIGFNKYPKCPEHKYPLVFVDEFLGDFLQSVHACLFDESGAPPKKLIELINEQYPKDLHNFIHKWMYCSSLGRGAKMLPGYLDSLSRAYINSLNKRQKSAINNNSFKKKRDKLITLGFKKIEMEFIEFLKKLYDMNEKLYNKEEIKPHSQLVRKILHNWLEDALKKINHKLTKNNKIDEKDSIFLKKSLCDKILQVRTCMLILGKSPSKLTIKISAFELFAAYREFLEVGLCTTIVPDTSILMIKKKKGEYLEELKKLAISKGGNCLSETFIDNKTKLKFVCQRGHLWQATPNSIKDGTWCPDCYLNKENFLNQLKKIAEMKGGICLSEEYINSHTHLQFRCQLGHEWKATPNNIKNGKWCPKCSQSRSERICRKFFEEIFEEKFPQTKFKWLKNSEGNLMHLDGFNSKLRLAFEYNGIQHYKFKKNWFKTKTEFEKRKLDDKTKKNLCSAHKITLIEIPYTIKFDHLENYIFRAAKRAGIYVKERKRKLDWRKFKVYSPNKLKTLQEIANKRGGVLLSKFYYNNRTKLTFQCSKGHLWKSRPYRIKIGDWCPECYQEQGNELKGIKAQELLEVIMTKNGHLLSDYESRRTKVKIQCSQGHIWEALPIAVKSGSWCPECHHNKEFYLNEIKDIARQRGGKCLSNDYLNNKTKLKFICENGHEWWAIPKSIKEGTWCPHCYKIRLN